MAYEELFFELAQVCWEGGTLDGGTLQDILVKNGVLVEAIAEKPCSQWCNCKHNDAVFPTTCYRLAAPPAPAIDDGTKEQDDGK